MINVDGETYRVIESLGYQHSAGCYAKVVDTPEGERIAVKRGGVWVWWTAKDRLQPRGKYQGQEGQG
jgi:hypothetical protein